MRRVTRAAWPSSTLPLCQTVVLLALSAAAAHAQFAGIGLSSVRAQAFFNQDFDGFPPEAGDRFAAALAVGDFNGDGAQDLATGIPEDNGPWDLPLVNAGAVVVRWGVPGAGLTPAAPTLLSLYSSGLTQAHFGDYYGYALAAGDFDGDGRDDLAVGIPYLDTYECSCGDRDIGAVQIHYGIPGGIQLEGGGLFYTSPINNTFDPPGLLDYFGRSLAAGDFDGDGYDDLAIGAPQINDESWTGGGAVIVLHGGPFGLVEFFGYMIHQDDPAVPDEEENPDNFGWALAAGNFNGDGRCIAGICRDIEDLAISAPGEDGVGAVMVILGSDNGLVFANSFYFGQANFGGVGEANDQFGGRRAPGQTVARNILGRREPFDAVPFFWTHLFDVAISNVGHADRPEAIEVHGSLADREATVVHRSDGRIAAVANVLRNSVSLRVEAAMERGDEKALAALAAG